MMVDNSGLPAKSSSRLPALKPEQALTVQRPSVSWVGYALSRPMTVIPIGLGVALLALLAVQHVLIFLVLGALAFGVGGVSFFAYALARKGQESLSPEAGTSDSILSLKHALSHAQYEEATSQVGERASEQLKQAADKYKTFQKILGEKFDPSELTYGRYLNTAEQVYLSVLDHLQTVSTLLSSVASLKTDYAKERLKSLPSDSANDSERQALTDRLKMSADQMERSASLLSFNEKALTEIDRVSLALSQIQTQKGRASVDLDASLKELEELARRAKKYSLET